MIDLASVLKPCSDVRYRVVDGEAVVVQQQDARVMSLNETGTHILAALDGKRTVADILATMSNEYDVPGETLRSDVIRYLNELIDAHVLESGSGVA